MEGIIVNHVTKSFKEETVLKDVDYSAAAKPPVRKNGNHLSG